MFKIYSVVLIFLFAAGTLGSSKLRTVYEWKYFDFDWKSPEQKRQYTDNGYYDYENIVPIDVDVAKDGRVFITTIRDEGVPATLSVVSNKKGESGHLLKPYPDWSWNDQRKCDSLIDVYRVAIDKCNRLWAVDNGKIGENQVCPAKLVSFDLNTNKVIRSIEMPEDIYLNKDGVGLLVNIVVETSGYYCDRTRVFMADVDGFGLVVWDGVRFHRLEHQVYDPVSSVSNYTIAGESFTLNDGVLGLALSPKTRDGSRYLFFRPMSSLALYLAKTSELADRRNLQNVRYYGVPNLLPSQAAAQAFSQKGILFYGLTSEIAIGCWNMARPLNRQNIDIAVTDEKRLQFVSGLKVISNFWDETIWILSDRLQKVMSGTLDFDEINFRIMKISVSSAVSGTKC